MEESGQVPRIGRIRTSTEKHSRRVPENGRIFVSIENWENPGEYREKVESMRVSKNFLGEYRKESNLCQYPKMEESGRVPRKGIISASTEKYSRREPERGRICVSTENW